MTPSTSTTSKPGRLLARYLKSVAVSQGDLISAAAYASSQRWVEASQIADVLNQKAAVGAMNSTSHAPIADAVGQDLAALVAPYSVVGRLQNFRRVPARTALVSQEAGATAFWGDSAQGQGAAIPVSSSAFSRFSGIAQKRVSAISVITDELARSGTPDAEATIAADLGRAIGVALDRAFLDPYTSGSPSTAPASVTASGRIFAASASTIDGIDSDLEKLVAALYDAGSDLTSAVFVLNTLSAARLSRMRGSSGAPAYPQINARGGVLLGFPVLTTSNVPRAGSPSPGATTAHLIDPSRIWLTDTGAAEFDFSRAAVVEMDNAPSADASTGTGASTVSMFQTDSVACKATRWIGWQPITGQSHAATLSGCEW
jgi:HK97 family phage major capsid protein